MNKTEYLKMLDKLNLDPKRYCIISGGVMLVHELKSTTQDIDILVQPDYFEELRQRPDFHFTESDKYPDLYELDGREVEIEMRVMSFKEEDVEFVDGYPAESLEQTLKWMVENNRPKDREKIAIIRDYLERAEMRRWLDCASLL